MITVRETVIDIHIEPIRITIVRFLEEFADGVVSFLAHECFGGEEGVSCWDERLLNLSEAYEARRDDKAYGCACHHLE